MVAIGASAGGLEACKTLLDALPAVTGMSFIVVQHLDPSHDSLLVELLAAHTKMPVAQAVDRMPIEIDRVYVIPPAAYLSVDVAGVLRLSTPAERHGARLPFDFLLNSLAEVFGPRAIVVILSGMGADGSLGLRAIKAKGGYVIAQEFAEAGYDGMPRAAVATGAVDLVAAVADIARALTDRRRDGAIKPSSRKSAAPATVADLLPEIIGLLRTKTSHDFSLYKRGTLERRVERRMAMASIPAADAYLALLRRDSSELDELSRDLLINVTSFFRDPAVFAFLEKDVIPAIVRDHPPERPLRIWSAGCSTGEECYSLAILFRESIAKSGRPIHLQIFASDVDTDAVAAARDGLYPQTIEANVTPERLANNFTREDRAYRVSPELRANVVFTVQDVLADPPFARLDFISCRNLLIYLQPEAQAKATAIFHFALREGGLLLVGAAEAIAVASGHFAVVSKPERLYRRTGGNRGGDFAFAPRIGEAARLKARPGQPAEPSRQTLLAELCRRLVVENYGPAAVLINAKLECLHFQGPTDTYLKLASGRPSLDLIGKAREGVRAKLRMAIQGAQQSHARFVVTDGRLGDSPSGRSFSIAVEPVAHGNESLMLVCFIETLSSAAVDGEAVSPEDAPRVADLEKELKATKLELQTAVRNLESSSEEQMAINEEALSVNEEYQSTNEELLASKEELQSLNEELTALNSQLQETLERQRTTADDLQNVLYSTDVATIFLDTRFNIRFFTPATKALFNVIPGDVGRPLTDLKSLAIDGDLLPDARAVLSSQTPISREVEGQEGVWFIRRTLPYRTRDKKTEGVVITFEDVTARRNAAEALSVAKREAESASLAKSRFLAAASHDLRQPLQTLALLQGLLAKKVEGEKAQQLVGRIDEALGAMTAMLNILLDINQIEVGAVKAAPVDFAANDILDLLRNELTYHAQSSGLVLKVIPCSLFIRSDPRLLEQMLRNLLSNALKYTHKGRVLVGCRRRSGHLRIEVWDTGLGIASSELKAIFEEYHQVDNAARQRSRGLGLGLSIVKSLGDLLGHPVRVRSLPGKGSVFSIEVDQAAPGTGGSPRDAAVELNPTRTKRHTGSILVIEDDPEVRDHMELFLSDEGFRVSTAIDGPSALAALSKSPVKPDLVLADYNLPNGMNGVEIARALRLDLDRQIPVIILTGDITTQALRDIALHDCVQFNKPAKLRELLHAIDKLLAQPIVPPIIRPEHALAPAPGPTPARIYVVDDDDQIRGALRVVLEDAGRVVETFSSCEAFLELFQPKTPACLLVDAYLPGMSGVELLQKLRADGHGLPSIMITGDSDVAMAVAAMKAGASDFIEKPVARDELIASIDRALELAGDSTKSAQWRNEALAHLSGLTTRQREVMERVLAGHPSKNIAADLGISQRTVENHRASIMKRTGSKSLPALARLALVAEGGDEAPPADGHAKV